MKIETINIGLKENGNGSSENTDPDMNFLADIALEIWRLSKAAISCCDGDLDKRIQYSIKKLEIIMGNAEVKYVDLTNKPYDAGSSVDVIYIEDDKTTSLESTEFIISKMVSPIILYKNELLRFGQVILKNANHKMEVDHE